MKINFVNLEVQHKLLAQKINKAFNKIIKNSSFVLGDNLDIFEKNFAKFCGSKYCVGVANGTQAIELALKSLGVKSGDEVILPVNTFIATAEAVVNVGATPVFVDVREEDLLIDPEKVEKAISLKTKAIIGVHLFGQPCDVQELRKIASQNNIFFIEDAAQAHGATFKRKSVGSFGKVACFSFYPAKNLGACGDGGAVMSNSKKVCLTVKKLRDHGGIRKYQHDVVGTNSRLDNLQAAILNIKLKYLRQWNKKRIQNAKYYTKALSNVKGIQFLKQHRDRNSVFHLYVVRTKKRNQLMEYLKQKNIQVGIHYPAPIHLTKAFHYLSYKKGKFPVAEKASCEILSLPMYPELTKREMDYVVKYVQRFYGETQ